MDGSLWEAEPEVQESLRIKGEDECKEMALKLSARPVVRRRASSAASHHQTSSISILLAILLLVGLRC